MFKTTKQQVAFIIFSILLAGFSLGSIIYFTDPGNASPLTFGFFYLSLFLFSLGVFTLIGLALRHWVHKGVYIINLSNSFRQGLLISVLIVASFILLARHLLFWWVEMSLILFLAFVEAFLNLKV